MEIIYTEMGANKGRISVARTLATMNVGEAWEPTTDEVDAFYIRTACWKLNKTLKREFSVRHTAETGNTIIITRLS